MGKMSEVAAASKIAAPNHKLCSIAIFKRGLTPEEQVEFEEILHDPSTTVASLIRAVEKEYEVSLSYQQTARHRRGTCSCR